MFQCTQQVRFTDIDVVGNVNYSVYLVLVDDSLVDWWHCHLSADSGKCEVVAAWMKAVWLIPITRAGSVAVTLRMLDVGTSSFELHSEILLEGEMMFAARIRYVHCASSGQPVPLPSAIHAELLKLRVASATANELREITLERTAPQTSE